MLPELDRERLLHIRDAARKIGDFTAGLTEESFSRSDLVQHGVIHCLYIIGEAASRITRATRERFPGIEWEVMRGMRNRLAHAYYDIDLGIVWQTAVADTPELLRAIEGLLSSDQ